MKLLIILLNLISVSAFSYEGKCPDFSGDYVDETVSEVLSVSQWGCVTIRMTYRNHLCATFADQLVFDGAKYSAGSIDSWQSHVINQNDIIGEHEWNELGKTFHARSRIYLDSNRNLVEEYSTLDDSGNVASTSTRKFTNAMGDGAPELPSCKQP